MTGLKTQKTEQSVDQFIQTIEHDQRRADALILLDLFNKITKQRAHLWGEKMIGFNQYHYKHARSKQEGDWPMIAFTPGKQKIAINIMNGFDNLQPLLDKLGKYKNSVGCLYINKLEDVDLKVLEKLISTAYKEMQKKYPSS